MEEVATDHLKVNWIQLSHDDFGDRVLWFGGYGAEGIH